MCMWATEPGALGFWGTLRNGARPLVPEVLDCQHLFVVVKENERTILKTSMKNFFWPITGEKCTTRYSVSW